MTVSILIGDVRDKLAELPADYFDCVVTSPPYWGLRDYDVEGQIGLEPTIGEHLAVMVEVFCAVRRVLKPTGTLWLNYGDCYATTPNGRSAADTKATGNDDRTFRDKPFSTIGGALKPKDLCMVPNRLAIALQDDGWWVRSEIIWAKPNPMPDSSGRYRPATAHEKVFLLAKSADGGFWTARDTGEVSATPDLSERVAAITTGKLVNRWMGLGHYYNAAAVFQACSPNTNARLAQDVERQIGSARANAGAKTNGTMKAVRRGGKVQPAGKGFRNNEEMDAALAVRPDTRNLRNYEPAHLPVWNMCTAAFADAHFATFPPELVERCLSAGCPPGGRVLDPFGGAGTTALVADYLGLDCMLIELNPGYAEIAARRIKGERPCSRVDGVALAQSAGPLFGDAA